MQRPKALTRCAGDRLSLFVRPERRSHRGFCASRVRAAAISDASASLMTEAVKGKSRRSGLQADLCARA